VPDTPHDVDFMARDAFDFVDRMSAMTKRHDTRT